MKKRIFPYLAVFSVAIIICSLFSFGAKAANEQAAGQIDAVSSKSEGEAKITPRIDNEAASTVRESKTKKTVSAKSLKSKKNIYPQNFWMIIFGAYVFLMIFNLSFDFGKKKEVQWFWEAALTFLAIFLWDNLDVARANSWFPGVILESGIIIYGFYFYFFREKIIFQKK